MYLSAKSVAAWRFRQKSVWIICVWLSALLLRIVWVKENRFVVDGIGAFVYIVFATNGGIYVWIRRYGADYES